MLHSVIQVSLGHFSILSGKYLLFNNTCFLLFRYNIQGSVLTVDTNLARTQFCAIWRCHTTRCTCSSITLLHLYCMLFILKRYSTHGWVKFDPITSLASSIVGQASWQMFGSGLKGPFTCCQNMWQVYASHRWTQYNPDATRERERKMSHSPLHLFHSHTAAPLLHVTVWTV